MSNANRHSDQKEQELRKIIFFPTHICPANILYWLFYAFQEYLARLGIDTRGPPLTLANISHGASYQTLEGGGDISSMVSKTQSSFSNIDCGFLKVYSRLAEDARSDKNSMVSGGNNSVYARTGHPVSITGSLSRWANTLQRLCANSIVSRWTNTFLLILRMRHKSQSVGSEPFSAMLPSSFGLTWDTRVVSCVLAGTTFFVWLKFCSDNVRALPI